MGPFKRFTTTILASFDSVVTQIENHESLVTSAIKEVEQSAGRAKAQLLRVRADGTGMRKRIAEYVEQAKIWKERAKKAASLDEAKAIECLKRHRRFAHQVTTLEAQEREHARLERQLSEDLESLEDKLRTLRQQRNLLRTRQSRAEAAQLVQQVDSGTITEIDEIFTRWEAKVLACEGVGSLNSSSGDDLEQEFETQEEQCELRELLIELTKEEQLSE